MTGLLAPYIKTIRELHHAGKTPSEIARVLHARGVRVSGSSSSAHQLANLTTQILFAERRLGLRPSPGDKRSRVAQALALRRSGKSLKEIGAHLGVSRECARQLVRAAEREDD